MISNSKKNAVLKYLIYFFMIIPFFSIKKPGGVISSYAIVLLIFMPNSILFYPFVDENISYLDIVFQYV